METRFVAYDRLGARRGVIPNPLEVSFNKAYNELTTLTLHYDRSSPKIAYLDNEPELAIEVLIDNVWTEIRDARLRVLSDDFDHLEEAPTRQYQFLGVGEALKGVLVYKPYGLPLNDEGRVNFGSTTVGRVIDIIWTNAENRGWHGFTNTFTATTDSAGNPWDKSFIISYDVDANLLGILNSFVAMGLVDIVWQGRTLNLYNKGYLETDLSVGPDPLRFVGTGGTSGVDAAPEKNDFNSLATHVVVLGENNLRWEFPTGATVAEGRREIVQSYSGVDDLATAQVLAAPIILKAQNHLKNTTRQFHLTPDSTMLPFIDYEVGSWIQTQRGTVFERLQIIAINLQINDNGTQGYVTLGDKIDGLLEKMYQRIQGLSGGIKNEGTKPPVPSARKPTAPTTLQGAPSVAIDERGKSIGFVNLAWDHDGKDILGGVLDIKEYQVFYRELGSNHWLPAFTTKDRDGSIPNLEVYKPGGDLYSYQFAVLAVSTKGMVSDLSATETILMVRDEIAPDKPTTPTASVWLRTPRIDWNGKLINGTGILVNPPLDFSHIVIWGATDPLLTDKVEVGRIGTLRSFTDIQRAADVTRFYALQAYDYSGNASEMSDVASVTPTDLVNEQTLSDALDAMSGDIGANVTATQQAAADAAAAEQAAIDAAADAATAQARADKGVSDAAAAKTIADQGVADAAAVRLAAEAAQAAADAAQAAAVNVIRDPSFEANPPVWPLQPGVTINTTQPHSGTKSIKTTGGVEVIDVLKSPKVDVIEGQTWRWRLWYRCDSDYNGGAQSKLWLGDQSGNQLVSDLFVKTTVWVLIEHEYVVPAGVTKLYVTAKVDHLAGGIWFDDFEFTNITEAKAAQALAQVAADSATDAQNAANAAQDDATQALTDSLAAKNAADAAKTQADKGVADAKAAADAAEAARILAVAAQSTADGKTTVSVLAPTNADAVGKPANALWTQVVNGKAVGAWYKATANATTWTSMPFDPVMIPVINIGTGTFGDLDGIRIAVNSLKARSLFVGSYSNQVPNGDGDAGIGWGAFTLDTSMVPGGESIAGSFKAIPTQTTAQNHSELWLIDRTRMQLFSTWMYADAANSRAYFQMMFYDRTKTYINTVFYPVNNQVVPTVWTKFTQTFVPATDPDVPGAMVMPSNAMYATIRIFPNHINGSAVANQYFAGVTMRELEAGELVVDGKIKTRHLAANSVTAGKLEADLALITRIIAGPETAVHAEMSPEGFKVFGVDPDDGHVYETVSMGVQATDDLFALTDSAGNKVVNLDSKGAVNGLSVSANDTLFYKGKELSEKLLELPQGLVTWRQFPRPSSYTYPTLPSAGGEVGLFEIGWDTSTDNPARLYSVNVPRMLMKSLSGAATTMGLVMRFTDDGTPPTVNSQIITHDWGYASAGGWRSAGFNGVLVGSANGPYIRILVTMWSTGGCSVDPAGLMSVSVEDMGPSTPQGGSFTSAGGTVGGGTVSTAPANPVVTRTVEYGYSSVRSFLASNAQYAYNQGKAYQGLSPAGYGNLRSMYCFPSVTGVLSGATVNDIWVYLYFEHWYANAGGTARIGLHPNSSIPATWNTSDTLQVSSAGWPKGAGRWVRLPSSTYAGFVSGAWKGLTLLGDSTYNTYGIANNARLKIRYTK